MIKVIAFDGDDTLWHHENIFYHTRQKFKKVMDKYGAGKKSDISVSQAQINNLSLYGYGIKGFTLSMIEEAIRLTKGGIRTDDIAELIDFGKDMLRSPVMLCDDVKETLEKIYTTRRYRLMVITKGDLFDQEKKIVQSGLAHLFDYAEVVAEKDKDIYAQILNKNGIDVSEFLMVGNSVKSDILPVLELGGRAVHIPYHTTWGHEHVPEEYLEDKKFPVFETVAELPAYLEKERPL